MANIAVSNAQNWRLWSHHSWRALAAHSTVLITTVFVVLCAKSVESLDETALVLTEGSSALAKGGSLFFAAGWTLFGYSTFQKENQIRRENLSILVSIGRLSDTILKKYNLEPEKHSQLDKLIASIKSAALGCISLRTKNLELVEQFEEVNELMQALNKRLQIFISTLPSSLEQLKPETLEHEKLFWQQDPLDIKEELVPTVVPATLGW